jgi:hypothetical protein
MGEVNTKNRYFQEVQNSRIMGIFHLGSTWFESHLGNQLYL